MIANERISHLSTEYVRTLVIATENGAAVDPTADTVQIAFPAQDAVPTVWFTASWETAGTLHYARCLVGPEGGETTLAVGLHDMYVRAVDNPETPVKKSGLLEVY